MTCSHCMGHRILTIFLINIFFLNMTTTVNVLLYLSFLCHHHQDWCLSKIESIKVYYKKIRAMNNTRVNTSTSAHSQRIIVASTIENLKNMGFTSSTCPSKRLLLMTNNSIEQIFLSAPRYLISPKKCKFHHDCY